MIVSLFDCTNVFGYRISLSHLESVLTGLCKIERSNQLETITGSEMLLPGGMAVPMVPNLGKKIYLVCPSRFSLCRSTRFYTVFGSIWTQVGLKFLRRFRMLSCTNS